MRKRLGAYLAIIGLVLVACSGVPPPPSPTTPPVPDAAAKPGQKSGWDSLVEAAQKEGTVVVYANVPPQVRQDVIAAFKTKYAVTVEFLLGRPNELVARIKAERNAGISAVDFGILGKSPYINDIKPMGIAQPLEPMLLLPEVKDPKNWRGGKLPFADDEKTGLAVTILAVPPYHRNINLVKEGEVTRSRDLLDARWKGKIAILDPSIFGSSNSWFTWMLTEVLGMEEGRRFMKDLAAQNPLVTRDDRQLVEGVAKGKYSIGIGPSPSIPAQFIGDGAPITFIDLKEPRYTTPGWGFVEAFKDAPHPNATKLFLNWLLSKEGSAILSAAGKYASTRADVPPQGIPVAMAPLPTDMDPEEKYPDYQKRKGDMLPVAAEIFGALRK